MTKMTAEERYTTDPMFHSIVTHLKQLIALGQYTPTELREALILAATQYYSEHPRPLYITASEFIHAARSLIARRQQPPAEPVTRGFDTDQGPSQPYSNMEERRLSERTVAALNLKTDEEAFLALLEIMQVEEADDNAS